ncbi:redoxin domain-containing protein [uncultured Aquimarina sp.]|uniref:TlpA family protein disulfide reductase n=1 Tax=uncultured Aquimarina sp. TaxID=575652 RepID=UPI0026350B43|nr:redoxin domain-containing protein [uncultured Aquimarina sp.]
MKTFLKTTIVVFGLGLLCFLGYKMYAKIQYKSEVKTTLQHIPEFSFQTLEKQSFTRDHLDPDKATVFIYFNSGCDYCQHEATMIEQHVASFKNTQLIFVSDEDPEQILHFSIQYKLHTYDYITFLSDPRNDFAKRFDATSVPYLLIYDQNQQLVKRQKGQVKSEKLLALLSTKTNH